MYDDTELKIYLIKFSDGTFYVSEPSPLARKNNTIAVARIASAAKIFISLKAAKAAAARWIRKNGSSDKPAVIEYVATAGDIVFQPILKPKKARKASSGKTKEPMPTPEQFQQQASEFFNAFAEQNPETFDKMKKAFKI
jgi:hypothetical protein